MSSSDDDFRSTPETLESSLGPRRDLLIPVLDLAACADRIATAQRGEVELRRLC